MRALHRMPRYLTLGAIGVLLLAAGLLLFQFSLGHVTAAGLPTSTKLYTWKTVPGGAWITGTLNATNSNYSEGETVPFELDVGNLNTAGNPYTFSICRDYQNGSVFGYIALSPFNTSRAAIPDGTVTSTNGNVSGVNATINSVTEIGGQGACNAGARETQVSINSVNNTSPVYVLWGGRLAKDSDPGVGPGNGAGSYPGSSLLMKLLSPAKSSGITGIIQFAMITATKVVDGGPATADQWCFNISPNPQSETLPKCPSSGGDTVTFVGLSTGSYTITETSVTGYVFASGTGSNCTFSGSTATASVVTGTTPTNASCTFHNTDQATLTVNKNFVPDSGASVSVSVTCSSGTPSPASGSATESTPFVTTVTGFAGGATCTATESPVPAGYTANQTNCAGVGISPGGSASCTITNTQNSAFFVVNKDFIPNNAASVTVSLSCTSGAVAPASALASEAVPASFTVIGYNAGATCTATESPIPAGYTSTGTCSGSITGAPSGSGGCTITNTQNSGTFVVNKDFTPNSGASVSVSVTCTSGTPSPASGSATEATPFATTVTGYSGSPTCTATESPIPAGYTSTGTCTALLSAGSCMITNTQTSATLSVYKDFIPNNAATVAISVTCTSGTPSPASGAASESSPFSTTVMGFSIGATCTATETIPSGYTANQTLCASVAISVGGTHSCTIVNDLNPQAFIVNKDFVPNSGASVNVSISCASGTPTPASGTASESTPFNTVVTGYTGDPLCTATESPIPTGYSSSATCNAALSAGSCTITNTQNSATFTVVKDFVPNSGASVSVSITCTSGTPSPASGSASEATPFATTVTGYSVGATCTATETVPAGYTSSGTCNGAITGAPSGTGTCTITNTQTSATLTVNKDFVPNNGASVSVSITCTSGTPTPSSGSASEATPFVTTITGFSTGATCTATEAVPSGYTASQAACASVAITNGGSASCTITNTLNNATLTVNKDFIPNSGASVSVSVTCTSGTPTPASGSATEAIPFVTTVSGFIIGTTCTATETVPSGYTANQANCLNVAISVGGSHSCTITNTQNSATFTVVKDFVPNSGASVSVSITCTSGTPSPASGSASEATPFATAVTGYSVGATCTATETIPAGYTSSGTCNGAITGAPSGSGTCTIVNTQTSATLTVNKDFVPNNAASVPVSVICTSGTPSPASGSASEATPFVTTITGFSTGATCTATETVPGGYTANQAACASVAIVNGGSASCTIINSLKSGTFTVNKDFVPNNAASVAVSVSCTSGTPSPASGSASEATPFVTTVTGFLTGATCTATESVPAGYTANQTNCSGVTLFNGNNVSCTITNTLNTATLTVNKDFVPNNAAPVAVIVTCTSGTPSPASGSASEATPFVSTISGFSAGATCTTTETVPGGYAANQANCSSVAIIVNGVHSCTITNTLIVDTFAVNKDFVPNNGASVSVSVSCASGTATPPSGTASEATPFVTTISGPIGDPLCTATESPIPTGYSSSGTCNAALSAGYCTITNTLNTATLTVNKDFVPNNAAPVAVIVTCTSGTPSPASGSASEATPFTTTISGFSAGATCTTTETVPGGYTASQTNCASVSVSIGGSSSCTITNTLNSATLTVNKTFSPSSGASVSVSVTCTSGTPTPASGSASTATPFTTAITGFTVGATCTATETVPGGYTASQAPCAGVAIAVSGVHSCAITNTLNSATFTINKDFVPNNGAPVSVSVTCTSGTPAPASGSASEATPFTTTVTGYSAGASCTATELPIPAGYTSSGTCTGAISGAPSGSGSCTITNDLNTATFTVNKDFVPNNAASVAVSVTCTSGTPSPAAGSASEATPFTTTVTGYTPGASCTATESPIPPGYFSTVTCSGAISGAPSGGGSCTILNSLNVAIFTVQKDFVPNSGASVSVSVTCTSGTPSPASGSASEATPFTTTVSGFILGASCTATESPIPAGYTSSGTCSATIVAGACIIQNILNTATFTVNKNFVPDSGASVSVSVTCTAGTPSPASGSAAEATPFTTTVTGYTAGASCTATESPTPAGYTSTGTCGGAISGTPSGSGSCTITNTARVTTLTVSKDFVPNNAASVPISVTCTSGTPSPASGSMSESTPFVTTVTAFNLGATCTATETIPGGYNASQAPCVSVAMVDAVPASCIITNMGSAMFIVNKDFVPNNVASVTVTLSCTQGTAAPASAPASESAPAMFTVTGASGTAVCTATESPIPPGYNSSGTCNATMAVGSCTIVNTLAAVTPPPPTVDPASITPSPCGGCPVGGEVFLPVAGTGSGAGDSAVGLAVMILIGVTAVASIGGSWKMSRRSRD